MTTIRDTALGILDRSVPEGAVYRSNENPPTFLNNFSLYTNTNHLRLLADWAAGGIMTACNGFVGWYANEIGIKGITEWFTLQASLDAIGKGHAWVKPAFNVLPKCGDILKHKILHVDVALEMKNGRLRRVAAGQGDGSPNSLHVRSRPPAERALEYDVLRRVTGDGPYNPANLEGWLDLDKFFGPTPQFAEMPKWVLGWWTVTWRGMIYYYYFSENYEVRWIQVPPISTAFSPPAANDVGDVTVAPFGIVIRWRTSGSVEKFFPDTDPPVSGMWGTWNDNERITGVKM